MILSDGNKIRDSYISLTNGIPPEKREELLGIAKKMYPQIAELLIEQFKEPCDTYAASESRKDKVAGAMYMFLAFINASLHTPVVPLEKTTSMAVPEPFPQFGNLQSLR